MSHNLETLSNIQRILNKINNDNHQVLVEKILSKCQDQIKDKEIATVIVNRIFSKVNEEFNLLSVYIELFEKLSIIFNQNLSINIGKIIIELYKKEISNLKNQSSSTLAVEIRSRVLNYSKFIGESYKSKIFESNFLSEMLGLLLSSDILHILNPSSQNECNQPQVSQQQPSPVNIEFNKIQLLQIESLATILAIVGKSINETQSIGRELDECISVIQKLIDNKTTTNLPPRVRFMFKNLVEFKNNKWKPPKTQSDLDIQAQKEIVHLAQSYGKSINKTLQDRCGQDENLQIIFWKKLFQSFSAQNYKIFKDLFIEEKSNSLTSSPSVPLSPFFLRTIASPIQLSLNNIHNANGNGSGGSNNSNNPNTQPFTGTSQSSLSISIPKFQNLMDIDQNLPNGFISPKISRPGQTSPLLSSIQKSEPDQIINPTSLHLNNQNTITTMDTSPVNPIAVSNNNNNSNVSLPEESNDLSIILSIIDSKIWNPQKEIWKKKILNKIYPIRSTLKKKQKIEIMAAIWHNMCDNQEEYGSYLDLCLTLIKMDEGEPVNIENESYMSTSSSSSSRSSNFSNNNNIQSIPIQPAIQPPIQQAKPENKNLLKVNGSAPGGTGGGRRSSVAVIQMKPNINLETRRSSISVISELSRRGSMSHDIPSSCPPAPKLRSTPTLKSTPHKVNPHPDPMDIEKSEPIVQTNSAPSIPVNPSPKNNSDQEPTLKKHKPNESDSFYTVLIESLQDDFALKMFVKKKSLAVYMELLKDLYREFIIEIPLLLRCISLVHNGLYELSDEECTLLFDLEELAQEQKNLEDENKSQNLLKKNNQFYQWKTDTWEEDQQSPPPPPSSYYDLSSDVFVL